MISKLFPYTPKNLPIVMVMALCEGLAKQGNIVSSGWLGKHLNTQRMSVFC